MGHIPHQGSHLASLDDMVRLNISKKLSKLDEFHQLIMIVSGLEPPGLRLHWCHHE
jgi:hypothetical protein